ncbi:SDR family NAD(P)-dependent oxidoreductase [Inquilinus sp. Marseille-Q2685]|uniref:SDR family NAD(P)-dependent oxidoreductase n=1 Tax=Inquilinus sp. Marseille-Q2685 TaxID=2866581 RepID=UPI001CE43001|nr:SDR family NAD(P)-dependent oxidoreductase [Inquilinus sp. Marseille-Q2685]
MAETSRPLEGRIALVTGASRGFGAAVAVRLAAAGAHVVCAARTVGGLEQTDDAIKAAGGSATLVPMDLSKFEQIDLLGGSLAQRFGKLDLLVANAAMLGHLGPVAYSDEKVWARVLDLNLNANYRLIRSVDPLLRAAAAPRAVFVTDRIARSGIAYWSAYAVAKAGLDTLAGLYAAETAKTPLRVALFHPGPMATRLREQGFPGEAAGTQPAPDAAADRLVARLLGEDGLAPGKAADWD